MRVTELPGGSTGFGVLDIFRGTEIMYYDGV